MAYPTDIYDRTYDAELRRWLRPPSKGICPEWQAYCWWYYTLKLAGWRAQAALEWSRP